jgi:hypothetical protein
VASPDTDVVANPETMKAFENVTLVTESGERLGGPPSDFAPLSVPPSPDDPASTGGIPGNGPAMN